VDDGSSDSSGKIALQAGGQVLRHDTSRGKGAALRAGWELAREAGFTWVLTLDGDGQHSADDIPAFFQCADGTSAALVVGNRMTNAAAMPWLRRSVNRWLSRRLSRLTRQELPDSQCGFRLMNLGALANLAIETTHFEIESEVLVNFIRAGYRVEFVPIQVIYKTEQSKIKPFRDTLRWFRWWRRAKGS
jgi:glycosyltransferase involved in cell wall biosynthesis